MYNKEYRFHELLSSLIDLSKVTLLCTTSPPELVVLCVCVFFFFLRICRLCVLEVLTQLGPGRTLLGSFVHMCNFAGQ